MNIKKSYFGNIILYSSQKYPLMADLGVRK